MSAERDALRQIGDVRQRAVDEMRRLYSDTVIDHVLSPRNAGRLADADGHASVTTDGGDTMRIWIAVDDDRVKRATFWTDACAATVASLSMVTELVRGRPLVEAMRIGQQEVLDALDGLPEGNVHCAHQAVQTLKAAVQDYLALRKAPWKKAYRRY
jgi:nitrogen fixation NifU-like protein